MKTSSRASLKPHHFDSTLERLESRIAPAVVVSVVDLDGDGTADDIRIVGDAAKNIVTIEDNGTDTLTISIDADGNGNTTGKHDMSPTPFTFNGGSVTLDIKLGGGNDTLNYTVTANLSGAARVLTADLGPGKNAFNFTTGNADLFNGSRVSLDITGRNGIDTAIVDFDEVRKSIVIVNLALGGGNDTGTMGFDRIDDGASVDLGVDLGAGTNALTMDFQEIGFGDQGTLDVDVLGGAGKDNVTLNLHDDVGGGMKASRMMFKADLGAGDDVFTGSVDYAGNVFRVDDHSEAFIAVKGGAGNDNLSFKGVGASGTIRLDPDAFLAVDLLGGAGNDTISVDLGKTDALELIGTLRVRIDGGIGNDVLSELVTNNANSTGSYDLVMLGGAGNDNVTFQVTNNGGTTTLGVLGKALLDGGLGTDTLTDGNKPLSIITGFEQIL